MASIWERFFKKKVKEEEDINILKIYHSFESDIFYQENANRKRTVFEILKDLAVPNSSLIIVNYDSYKNLLGKRKLENFEIPSSYKKDGFLIKFFLLKKNKKNKKKKSRIISNKYSIINIKKKKKEKIFLERNLKIKKKDKKNFLNYK